MGGDKTMRVREEEKGGAERGSSTKDIVLKTP